MKRPRSFLRPENCSARQESLGAKSFGQCDHETMCAEFQMVNPPSKRRHEIEGSVKRPRSTVRSLTPLIAISLNLRKSCSPFENSTLETIVLRRPSSLDGSRLRVSK